MKVRLTVPSVDFAVRVAKHVPNNGFTVRRVLGSSFDFVLDMRSNNEADFYNAVELVLKEKHNERKQREKEALVSQASKEQTV